jgi:hypothetical protein
MSETEHKCIEKGCNKTFVITEGEEQFYTDKGFYLPKRCPDCRAKRRAEKEARMNGEHENGN